MELFHGFAEEHGSIFFRRAMRVELDEVPVRPLRNADRSFQPQLEAVHGWRLVVLQAGVFHAGKDAPFAAAPVSEQRALDHHECVGRLGSGADVDAGIVPLGLVITAFGVVDTVHFFSLCIAGVRGQGEVGIAAGFQEDLDFIIDAAPAAIETGVVQRPVAVDESVAGSGTLASDFRLLTSNFQSFACQQPMPIPENIDISK